MKSGRLFWGTLFVVLGGLILLNNFYCLSLPWGDIWKFWPVVLVLIGVSALLKGTEYRWIVNVIIAIVAGFVLFASVQNGCSHLHGFFEENGDDVAKKTIEVSRDSAITKAVLRIDGGAGKYVIKDTTSHLIRAGFRGNPVLLNLQREHSFNTPVL